MTVKGKSLIANHLHTPGIASVLPLVYHSPLNVIVGAQGLFLLVGNPNGNFNLFPHIYVVRYTDFRHIFENLSHYSQSKHILDYFFRHKFQTRFSFSLLHLVIIYNSVSQPTGRGTFIQ
jgi:hypothetical protein